MSLAYFPLYADDFEADTAHLTLEEDGAYNRLLRLCWRTPGCSLPNDRAWIHRKMRARTDAEKAVVDIVLDEFFTVEKNRISNARLMKEWLAANAAHDRRKNAGKKGGSAKALKTNNSKPSNAEAKPKQPEPEPEPEPVSEDTSVSSRRKTSQNEGFDEFWSLWPSKVSKDAARKAWAKLSRENKEKAYRAVRGGWFERWREGSPDANPIHAASFLDGKRWNDEFSPPQLKAINGGRHDRTQFDIAHREYARRVGAGEIDRGPDPSDPFAGG